MGTFILIIIISVTIFLIILSPLWFINKNRSLKKSSLSLRIGSFIFMAIIIALVWGLSIHHNNNYTHKSISSLGVIHNVNRDKFIININRQRIKNDKHRLKYLRNHKSLKNIKNYHNFQSTELFYEKFHKVYLYHNVFCFTPYTYQHKIHFNNEVLKHRNEMSLISYYNNQIPKHNNDLDRFRNKYKSIDHPTLTKEHAIYHRSFMNAFVFLYLLGLLIIFSICYLGIQLIKARNYHDIKQYNLKYNFKSCLNEIMDTYVFHLLPLLIAFVSGLVAILSHNLNRNFITTEPYSFLITYSIPILSSIQFFRIIYYDYKLPKFFYLIISNKDESNKNSNGRES